MNKTIAIMLTSLILAISCSSDKEPVQQTDNMTVPHQDAQTSDQTSHKKQQHTSMSSSKVGS